MPFFSLTFFFTLLIIVCDISHHVRAQQDIGPADIKIERIEECEDEGKYEVPAGVTMSKVNRTHAGISACMDLGQDMDENVLINITMAKWGDGGWKPNALQYKGDNACQTLFQYVKDPWETFLTEAGVKDLSCPIPKGRYCVDKLVFGLNGLFEQMLYGKFRVDSELIFNGSKLHRCVRMFIISEKGKGM